MDVLIALLLLIAAAIGSIATNMIASEFYDRAPLVARWIVARAAMRLPENERERYREEWLAHLEQLRGNLSKLSHAIDCRVRAAPRIATELQRAHPKKDAADELVLRIAVQLIVRKQTARMMIPLVIRGEFSKIRAFWRIMDKVVLGAMKLKLEKNATPQQISQYYTRCEEILERLGKSESSEPDKLAPQ